MPVSVKVYYGKGTKMEIRRFIFRPEIVVTLNQHAAHMTNNSRSASPPPAPYAFLVEKIRQLFYGLNLHDVHLCWKDDDGDYVAFSSDDELKVAINNTTDNTLRIYIKEKEQLVPTLKLRRPTQVDRPVRRFVSEDPMTGVDGGESDSVANRAMSRRSTPGDRRRVGDEEPFQVGENGDEPSLSAAPLPPVSNHQSCLPTTSNVVCSECQGAGRGVWYKCTCCNDFYLCSDCEHRGLHDQHIMVRTTTGHAPTTSR